MFNIFETKEVPKSVKDHVANPILSGSIVGKPRLSGEKKKCNVKYPPHHPALTLMGTFTV